MEDWGQKRVKVFERIIESKLVGEKGKKDLVGVTG